MRRENSAPPVETVKGEVTEVRVLRGAWGRLTLRLERGATALVVGDGVLGYTVGDTIEARGCWSEDPKWGRQFKAQTFRSCIPGGVQGAILWLASRLPGLGKKRAQELVERFGIPALYDVIANRPQELTAIKGITLAMAVAIQEEHARVRGEGEEMTQLLAWGLTDSAIRRAREVWGKKLLEVLRADPYRLAEEVHGFGFLKSDVIARRMGMPHDHPRRLQACIVHLLREAEGAGHCYVPRRQLVAIAAEDLGVRAGLVGAELERVFEEGRAIDEGDRVYLPGTHTAEREVAARALRFLRTAPKRVAVPTLSESEAA